MDVTNAKPRVNFDLLRHYLGKKVLLVGEIKSLENNRATVIAADGGTVSVELTKGPAFDGGQFFEFEAWVQTPNTVKEESRASYGSNFDLTVYNELCKLACGQHHQLFF